MVARTTQRQGLHGEEGTTWLRPTRRNFRLRRCASAVVLALGADGRLYRQRRAVEQPRRPAQHRRLPGAGRLRLHGGPGRGRQGRFAGRPGHRRPSANGTLNDVIADQPGRQGRQGRLQRRQVDLADGGGARLQQELHADGHAAPAWTASPTGQPQLHHGQAEELHPAVPAGQRRHSCWTGARSGSASRSWSGSTRRSRTRRRPSAT